MAHAMAHAMDHAMAHAMAQTKKALKARDWGPWAAFWPLAQPVLQ